MCLEPSFRKASTLTFYRLRVHIPVDRVYARRTRVLCASVTGIRLIVRSEIAFNPLTLEFSFLPSTWSAALSEPSDRILFIYLALRPISTSLRIFMQIRIFVDRIEEAFMTRFQK